MRCQTLYFEHARCKADAVDAGEWCRWHKLMHSFREDLKDRSPLLIQGLMFGSASSLSFAAYCAWFFIARGEVVWLALTFGLLGSAAKLFADGIIARDYPFAQLSLWPQMLTLGLLVEVVTASLLWSLFLHHHDLPATVVRSLTDNVNLRRWGPPLFVIVVAFEGVFSLRLLLRRVFFFWRPSFDPVINIGVVLLASSVVLPLVQAAWFGGTASGLGASRVPSPAASSALSGIMSKGHWASYPLGFIASEVVNASYRHRREHFVVFRMTIWPSFPICLAAPVAATVLANILAFRTGLPTPVSVGVAVLLSGVSAAIGTKWLVKHYLAKVIAAGDTGTSSGFGERLSLYLRPPLVPVLDHATERLLQELQLLLQVRPVGAIVDSHQTREFLVVHMIGDSADGMLATIDLWLPSTPRQAGSFALKRLANGHEERIPL